MGVMDEKMQENPDFLRRKRDILNFPAVIQGDVGAIVVFDPIDILYLTGAVEGIQALVLTGDRVVVFTPLVFSQEFEAKLPDCEIFITSEDPRKRPEVHQILTDWFVENKIQRVGFNGSKIDFQTGNALISSGKDKDICYLSIKDFVSPIRSVKDSYEIAKINECVSIAEKAFQKLLEHGAGHIIGKSEKEIAWELESWMRELGAEKQGFPGTGIIVAAGPKSAGVHPKPDNTIIEKGDLVLIDWGAEKDEYRSDSTRVVFAGEIPSWASDVFKVVKDALEESVITLKAGEPICFADLRARDVIVEAGYQEFLYGVGHGVGLEIHELPWMRPESKELMQENMLTTIEPGIYIPGKGGIRLENIYQITKTGSMRLGELTMDLEDLILS